MSAKNELPYGDMRAIFGETLAEIAEKNKNIIGVMPDIGVFVFDKFREKFGKRSINIGISEASAINTAAGIADETGGPVLVYGIDPFITLRAIEPFKVSVCDQNLNVKLVGSGAGLSYSQLGSTHHSTENLGALRSIPNLLILSPADAIETKKALISAIEYVGPVYLRISRDEPVFTDQKQEFTIGKSYLLKKGKDATIIGTGAILYHALEAAKILKKEKSIDLEVMNMHTIKPLDKDAIYRSAIKTGNILTLEEHNIIGGIGEGIGAILAESGLNYKFSRIGVKDKFCKDFGTHDDLRRDSEIAIPCICNSIENLLYEKKPQYRGSLCGVCSKCKH